MIKRSTWILLAVFALLLAVVFLMPQLKINEEKKTPTFTPTLESPFTFNVADVVEFEVVGSDDATVRVERSEDNTWKLVEPDKETSKTNNIEGVIAGVININLLTKIDPAPPADVSGFDPARYVVRMFDINGAEESFFIGALTPTSSGYYIQVEDGQVYVAEKIKIDQVIELVQNPPIKTTPTPGITEESDSANTTPAP